MVDESVLLKAVRVERVNYPSGQINKLDLGDYVTEGTSSTGTGTFAPTSSYVNWDTTKFRSAFDLTSDFTEDNIEGTSIRDKLLGMFTKRIAIDMETAGIEGDEDLTQTGNDTRHDRLCGENDGYQEMLDDGVTGTRDIDANGAAASYKLYFAMSKVIPARYRVAKPDYRFVVPSRTYDKWSYDQTQPVVTTSGGSLPNDVTVKYRERLGGGSPCGIPLFEVPLMPDDLSYNEGGGTDGSAIWLTPLKNLIFFIQRDITVEWDRVPRSDKWEVSELQQAA